MLQLSNVRASALNPHSKPFAPRSSAVTSPVPAAFHDDYGLRGLARVIETALPLITQQQRIGRMRNAFGSTGVAALPIPISDEDLGLPETQREQYKPLHCYMESPFREQLSTPLSSFEVPEEYHHAWALSDRLPIPMLNNWPTDLLFFIFYTAVGDGLQIETGNQLFERGWRWHKQLRMWVARSQSHRPDFIPPGMEKGFYTYFDPIEWRRELGFMTLRYDDLAERVLPPFAGQALPVGDRRKDGLTDRLIFSGQKQ